MTAMFLVLSLILVAVPLEAKRQLSPNVYVVDLDMRLGKGGGERVELVCNANREDIVMWKKGHQKIGHAHSKKLNVTVREFPDAGTYTCHGSNGQILSSFFLYINELYNLRGEIGGILKPNRDDRFIECVAKNHSGSFSCSWQPKVPAHHQFSFQAYQAEHGAIRCTEPKSNGLNFTVTCNYTEACPYGEEDTLFIVYLNATQQKKFSNYSEPFHLRDILRPDPPENLHKKNGSLCWNYPASWSSCPSFFPLEFNVNMTTSEETKKGTKQNKRSAQGDSRIKGGECVESLSVPVSKVRHFCVQARDLFQGSSWSDWACASM